MTQAHFNFPSGEIETHRRVRTWWVVPAQLAGTLGLSVLTGRAASERRGQALLHWSPLLAALGTWGPPAREQAWPACPGERVKWKEAELPPPLQVRPS